MILVASSSQLYTPSWLCSAKNLSKTKQKQLVLRQLLDSVFGPCRIGGADGRAIHLYPTLLPVPNKTCCFCGLPPKFACSVILRYRTSRQADLSRQKTYFVVKNTCLSEQTRICRDRTFVTTVMILVAPPVNETLQAGCGASKSQNKTKTVYLAVAAGQCFRSLPNRWSGWTSYSSLPDPSPRPQ